MRNLNKIFTRTKNRNEQKMKKLNDVNNFVNNNNFDSGFYEEEEENINGVNNYDPNESDLYIDPKK